MKTLQGLPLTVLMGRVDQWSTWKGSVNFARITCDSVDLGGQSMVNLEKIHEDFARITSDSVDLGVDQQSTWKGS